MQNLNENELQQIIEFIDKEIASAKSLGHHASDMRHFEALGRENSLLKLRMNVICNHYDGLEEFKLDKPQMSQSFHEFSKL